MVDKGLPSTVTVNVPGLPEVSDTKLRKFIEDVMLHPFIAGGSDNTGYIHRFDFINVMLRGSPAAYGPSTIITNPELSECVN
jgi:hypothetical protein